MRQRKENKRINRVVAMEDQNRHKLSKNIQKVNEKQYEKSG